MDKVAYKCWNNSVKGESRMNKWFSQLGLLFVFLFGFICFAQSAHADVYGTDNVLNGLITQQAINQTNKPQFGDQAGKESIDPVTGSITWRINNIHLPGRDGLDLDIGVMYQSNYSFSYTRFYNGSGNLKKYNYLLSRYDLGQGWSFRFPSVQHADGGYMYYHTGDGPVYRVDFSAKGSSEGYTHLIGYQGKDVQFIKETGNGAFSNGQATSQYYLEYSSKKREYFAADGRLLGIVDRYGNTITFSHKDRTTYDGKVNKVISSVTDSIGITVIFEYETNLQTSSDKDFYGEKIVVTVKDLAGADVQSVTYAKSRQNLTYNNNPDGKSPTLKSIKDQDDNMQTFYYEKKIGGFSFFDKSLKGKSDFLLLSTVEMPRGQTKFESELVTRNLGSSGLCEEFRYTKRYDQLRKSYKYAGVEYVGNYNHINFSYTGDYSGYPTYSDPNNLPSNYNFSSTAVSQSTTRSNGLATTSTFNGKQLPVSVETKTSTGERKVTKNLSYHSVFTQLATSIEQAEYGVGDSEAAANKLYISKEYTDWGAIKSITRPLTQTQMNNSNVKRNNTISYTYEPTFYQLQSQSGYQFEGVEQGSNSNYIASYTYDGNGRLRTYTNPKGEVSTTWYEVVNNNGVVTNNESNPNQVLSGKVQKITTFKNLERGKKTQTVTRLLADTNYAYPGEITSSFMSIDSKGQAVTQTTKKTMTYYMGTGLLKEEVDGSNNKTSYAYDKLGRIKYIHYPEFVNLNNERYEVTDLYHYSYEYDKTSVAEDSENAGIFELSIYSYRQYRNISTDIRVAINYQFEFYDGLGNLRRKILHGVSTTWIDSRSHIDDQGRIAYSRDVLGNESTASYDEWGRQDEVMDAYGNLYKTEHLLKARRNISYFVAADQLGAYRANPYINSNKSSYVEKDFDQWGQAITVRAYKDWPNTTQPVTENYKYDIVGNLIAYTDPANNTKRYTYDVLNRLTSVRDPLNQLTNVEYDLGGNIRRVYMQNADGATPVELSSKQYNELGFLEVKTDPANAKQTYAYNSLGQLVRSVDRMGYSTTNQYDSHNRLTVKTVTGNGQVLESKNTIGIDNIKYDRIQTTQNGTATSIMTTGIDNFQRITSVGLSSPGYSSSLRLTYDYKNRLTKQNNGLNNFNVNIQYNKLRLDKVQVNGQSEIDSSDSVNVKYSYYPDGKMKSLTYPPLLDGSILSTEYTYDSLNRMKTVLNKKGSAILSSFTYEYDNNGNITSIAETGISTRNSTYTYDPLNRIKTVSRSDGTSISYSYDLRGNRTILTNSSVISLPFKTTTYTYDLLNRLVRANLGEESVYFSYSADGLRYKKSSTEGPTIQYQYNLAGQVISESNASNAVQANYIRGDRLLAKKETGNNKVYYYLYNGHGDVVMMVDAAGTVANKYQYDEWGNLTTNSETVKNSFKYAGEVYDEETGLYYLRARYYDPSMGRFINEDTYEGNIKNPLSLNLYSYVYNNPLIYSDPTGHFAFLLPLMPIIAPAVEATFVGIAGMIAYNTVDNMINKAGSNTSQSAAPKEAPTVSVPIKPNLTVIQGGNAGSNLGPNKEERSIPDLTNYYVEKKKKNEEEGKVILYHYTDGAGYNGILASGSINPSKKILRPRDARHGDGVYLTDIYPNTISKEDLCYKLYNNENQLRNVEYYIGIDVTDLAIKLGKEHIYVYLTDNPLVITDRLVDAGYNWGTYSGK